MTSKILNDALKALEPNATFTTNSLPRVSSSSGVVYYAKLGGPSDAEQFTGEAQSLKAFAFASPGMAPRVLSSGTDEDSGKPWMISEYMDLSSGLGGASMDLARRLATEVHVYESPEGRFGFSCPTYCGATRLEYGWSDRWDEMYGGLIGQLLDGIAAKERDNELVNMGREIQSRVIPHLLNPSRLKIKPVLLHGDLWSGNVGTNSAGKPIIFDPASYYGHNEADLGIARMFGGFPSAFFDMYHSALPKSEPVDEYAQRADLYELFHHLNHTLLFGGGYASGAKRLMNRLLQKDV